MRKKDKSAADGQLMLAKRPLSQRLAKDLILNWRLYVLLLPGLISLVLFKLFPVGGMVIAFQNYSAFLGIRGSEWVGLENFKRFFSDIYFGRLILSQLLYLPVSYFVLLLSSLVLFLE